MHDFHRAAAQHVGRTHHQRIANFGQLDGFVFSTAVRLGGCFRPSFVQQGLETLAVFRAMSMLSAWCR